MIFELQSSPELNKLAASLDCDDLESISDLYMMSSEDDALPEQIFHDGVESALQLVKKLDSEDKRIWLVEPSEDTCYYFVGTLSEIYNRINTVIEETLNTFRES
jgi:6-phosphogluconate dehydrogenase (decarboxylating)